MKKNNPRFPLFVDLTDRKIVVVGAGNIAARRVRVLCQFSRDITVVAPQICQEIRELARKGQVRLICRAYRREDIYDAWMVLAATDDEKVNREVYTAARCLGAWVNVASDQNLCDFHFPGIVKRDPVVVGVNASGADHRLARRVREEIGHSLEAVLPEKEGRPDDSLYGHAAGKGEGYETDMRRKPGEQAGGDTE